MQRYSDDLYRQLWEDSLKKATEKQLGNFDRQSSTRPQSERLRPKVTERDKRIMHLHKQGMSNSRIGQIIGISRNTVSSAIDRCLRYERVYNTCIEEIKEGADIYSVNILQYIKLAPNNTVLYVKNKSVLLTKAEYAVACCIVNEKGEFCSLQTMIDYYFKDHPPVKKPQAAIRNAVAGLRMKLDQHDVYVAVRVGVGYKFVYK